MKPKFLVDYAIVDGMWKAFVVLDKAGRPGNIERALGRRRFNSIAEAGAYVQGLEDRNTDQFLASMVTFTPQKIRA